MPALRLSALAKGKDLIQSLAALVAAAAFSGGLFIEFRHLVHTGQVGKIGNGISQPLTCFQSGAGFQSGVNFHVVRFLFLDLMYYISGHSKMSALADAPHHGCAALWMRNHQ
jgi:hypothetical protein